MEKNGIVKKVDTSWLQEAYFSDPQKVIKLKKGEVLFRPAEKNERLYLILEGSLTGYIENEEGENFEIFNSKIGKFVGTYSYFSKDHISYSTVVAEEDSLLAFIDTDQEAVKDAEGRSFAEHFLPVIVNEIYSRQLLAQKINFENIANAKRLLQAEKMAALGQMAAGLAHELNNAIGVIRNKSEWLAERSGLYIKEKDTRGYYYFFEKGLKEGQKYSSVKIRKRKKELAEKFGITLNEARHLAEMGLTDDELMLFSDDLSKNIERIYYYFETGLALHDVLVGAKHASRVVASVKELGVSGQQESTIGTNINQSIKEALTLLKKMLEPVSLNIYYGELQDIQANPGSLVQVWVNIIKNACESLLASQTKKPKIVIKSWAKNQNNCISITDNGPGIPEELLPRIFQPNVTTKVKGLSFGFGLGLSIVQRLVEEYNGQVKVESKPGKTVFTICFPVSTGVFEL